MESDERDRSSARMAAIAGLALLGLYCIVAGFWAAAAATSPAPAVVSPIGAPAPE